MAASHRRIAVVSEGCTPFARKIVKTLRYEPDDLRRTANLVLCVASPEVRDSGPTPPNQGSRNWLSYDANVD